MSSQLLLTPPESSILSSPYRQSIWPVSENFQFRGYSDKQYDVLSRTYSLVSAKHNVPLPTPAVCFELWDCVAEVPNAPQAVDTATLQGHLATYLRKAKDLHGIGVPIAMCALARFKEGAYAPSDRLSVAGMVALKILSDDQGRAMLGFSRDRFLSAYIGSVLPAWWSAIRVHSPEQVDNQWGWAGKRSF